MSDEALRFQTDEVVGIEGEKRSNRVDVHGRDQPGIMHFRTADAVLGDEALPLWVYRRDIRYTRFTPEAENPWVKLYENCR